MTHKENTHLYLADDGKMLVRKVDGFVMGYGIDIGENDDISNYDEQEFTEEQIAQFWKSIGMEDPKKHYAKTHAQHSIESYEEEQA